VIRFRTCLSGFALVSLLLAPSALGAQEVRPIAVRYVSSTAVYLDVGRAEGLEVGTRLSVERAGEAIAEIEVEYVAEHSASCRIVRSAAAIQSGDRAIPLSPLSRPESEPAPAEPPPVPEIERPTPAPVSLYRPAAPRTRASGSIAFSLRNLSDDLGPSSDESTGRLSLRLRDLGGKPLTLRVRARSREISRDGYGPSVARSQSSDRLYELSLAWAPPEGRFRFQLGRLIGGPYASLGGVDGALAEARVAGGLWLGAFGGSRPELGELGFDTGGEKYGAFLRWSRDPARGPRYAELLVGAATERDDAGEASRDFVAVESRFGSGSRWWLSQRAEIDFNRDWREDVAGTSSQVSNAALAASFRISESWRAILSYDQRRNYLTAETRPRPEEVFTRYLREGGRLGLEWRDGSWSVAFGAGTERADTLDEPTDSGYFTVMQTRAFGLPLLVGLDGSLYQGGTAEGWVASLRGRWAFRAGHDLGLTVGASEAKVGAEYDLSPRSNEWVRLSGTLQLPARLWLYGEYELATGDDFEGDRAVLEVGYRF
jgi:hypothetical protein